MVPISQNCFDCPADNGSINMKMKKEHRNHCLAITRLTLLMIFRDIKAFYFKSYENKNMLLGRIKTFSSIILKQITLYYRNRRTHK